jgi:ABC-type arginine/histidine transport system permease subunit
MFVVSMMLDDMKTYGLPLRCNEFMLSCEGVAYAVIVTVEVLSNARRLSSPLKFDKVRTFPRVGVTFFYETMVYDTNVVLINHRSPRHLKIMLLASNIC